MFLRGTCSCIYKLEMADKFFDYYEANGWEIKGSKIKNWYSVLKSWLRKDNVALPSQEDIEFLIKSEIEFLYNDMTLIGNDLYIGMTPQEMVKFWIEDRRYHNGVDNVEKQLWRMQNVIDFERVYYSMRGNHIFNPSLDENDMPLDTDEIDEAREEAIEESDKWFEDCYKWIKDLERSKETNNVELWYNY